MISFRVRECPDATFVDVAGALDLKAAPVLKPALDTLVETGCPEPVVVDLSAATLIDAQNAGILTAAHRAAAARGRRIRVCGAEGRVQRLLEIVGVDKELGLRDDDPLPPAPRDAVDRTVELLLRARVGADPAAGDQLRRLAIECAQGLAYGLARRYRGRGEAAEDLNQVALIGLVNSVDRYDPERGSTFATFAVPTIIGELKRHFRDRGWQIRVPRRLQEVQLETARATG